METLSPRELEVLHLLADGLSTQEIADRLTISRRTVSDHTEAIRGKLAVRNLHGAVSVGYRTGLLAGAARGAELDVTTAAGRQGAWLMVRQVLAQLEKGCRDHA